MLPRVSLLAATVWALFPTAERKTASQVDACGNQLQTTATDHVSGAVSSELGPASKVLTKPYNKEVHYPVAKPYFAKHCYTHEQRT
jgi:hypothetical protein